MSNKNTEIPQGAAHGFSQAIEARSIASGPVMRFNPGDIVVGIFGPTKGHSFVVIEFIGEFTAGDGGHICDGILAESLGCFLFDFRWGEKRKIGCISGSSLALKSGA